MCEYVPQMKKSGSQNQNAGGKECIILKLAAAKNSPFEWVVGKTNKVSISSLYLDVFL